MTTPNTATDTPSKATNAPTPKTDTTTPEAETNAANVHQDATNDTDTNTEDSDTDAKGTLDTEGTPHTNAEAEATDTNTGTDKQIDKLRTEAAKYRHRLREAEATIQAHEQQIATYRNAMIEGYVEEFMNPALFNAANINPQDLINEDGFPDPEAINDAIMDVAETFDLTIPKQPGKGIGPNTPHRNGTHTMAGYEPPARPRPEGYGNPAGGITWADAFKK